MKLIVVRELIIFFSVIGTRPEKNASECDSVIVAGAQFNCGRLFVAFAGQHVALVPSPLPEVLRRDDKEGIKFPCFAGKTSHVLELAHSSLFQLS